MGERESANYLINVIGLAHNEHGFREMNLICRHQNLSLPNVLLVIQRLRVNVLPHCEVLNYLKSQPIVLNLPKIW